MDNAQKFFEDVKDLIKAIGTSSSVDQERDERSVENYVRQSANTNTNNLQTGGNTMPNTTEPDPQGDIAINKSFPTAGADHLISQETRPEGDVSVSDAPNNPGVVPNNATFDSSATSAIAPSKTDEVQTPAKVSITKSTTCPDCGHSMVHECMMDKADSTDADASIEKAAADDEVTENPADDEAVEKSVTHPEMKKSLWSGSFSPFIK